MADWRQRSEPLAAGANQVDWRVAVEHPELWWPAALGDQPLYDLDVAVTVDGETSDRRRVSHRPAPDPHAELRRLGQRGAAVPEGRQPRPDPPGPRRGHAPRSSNGTSSSPERPASTCCACTATSAGQSSTTPPTATGCCSGRTCRCMGLHRRAPPGDAPGRARRSTCSATTPPSPSGAVTTSRWPSTATRPARRRMSPPRRWAGFAAGQVLPSVNKTGLDRSIRRALEKADGSRPVVAHSGVLPHPAWGTDSHLYLGWQYGDERDLPALLARLPVLGRFVSEFGARAVPDSRRLLRARSAGPTWTGPSWPGPTPCRRRLLRPPRPARRPIPVSTPGGTPPSATRRRSSAFTSRRCAGSSTARPGASASSCLADAQPAVSCSVLDHERVPKAGYEALVGACAPVIVVADRLADVYAPGQTVRAAVHVVSDLRTPLVDNRGPGPVGVARRGAACGASPATWSRTPAPGSARSSMPCCRRHGRRHRDPRPRSSSGAGARRPTATRARWRLSRPSDRPKWAADRSRRRIVDLTRCVRSAHGSCRSAHDAADATEDTEAVTTTMAAPPIYQTSIGKKVLMADERAGAASCS